MNETIIIVEDDVELGQLLVEYLTQQNFIVKLYSQVQTATVGIKQHSDCATIILDIMLPDGDGLELCKWIRQFSNTPIIMLTAKGETMDRIIGLELGADDYMAKPFEPRELLARLKAIIRRQQTSTTNNLLQFGSLSLDTNKRQAFIAGNICDITQHQYELLYYLAQHAGQVLSREQLMNALNNKDLEVFDRSIDVHISRIRAAIEANPKQPERIKTLRGAGYLFCKEQN